MAGEPNFERAQNFKQIFKRSAARWHISAGEDPTLTDADIAANPFFNGIRGGQYYVKTTIDGYGIPGSRCFMVMADGPDAEEIPNLLIQCNSRGAILGALDMLLTRDIESGTGTFTPKAATPLLPGVNGDYERMAEKLVDLIVDHILTRGREQSLGVEPACMR